jgi:formate-dependent nitrite reductase membrane component NrfD
MKSSFADGWHIWGWEVSLYLFIGGLTDGIFIFKCYIPFLKNMKSFLQLQISNTVGTNFFKPWMFFLFLDITISSMSLSFYIDFSFNICYVIGGSWLLLVIYPVSIFLCCLLCKMVIQEYINYKRKIEPLAPRKDFKTL